MTAATIDLLQPEANLVTDSNGYIRMTSQTYASTGTSSNLNSAAVFKGAVNSSEYSLNVSFTDGLVLNGALTGVTNLTASGTVTGEQLTSTDDATITDDASVGGDLTVTGALDNNGGATVDGGNFYINDASGDYDFKYETDSTDNALFIDSGNSTLETNGVTVTLNQGGADVDTIIESDNVTDALKVDAGTDRLDWGTWYTMEGSAAIQAASYSITSTSRATYYDIDYTDTGIVGVTLDTDLVAYTGLVLGFCDSELNANTNNIQIGTEGAETINEANTYTMDANGECVWVRANGTNWHIINAYLE